MTTEEKARAYDEALERAKKLSIDGYLDAIAVEEIFPPEESEDERIRKHLIEIVETYWGNTNEPGKAADLAYLEKQKYDRMKPIYDARESFESALEKAWNDYHNGYENVDKLEDDYVECAHAKGFREGYLFGLEKQKEQKPSIFPPGLGEVHWNPIPSAKKELVEKPAEWSEEDEAFLKVAIAICNRYSHKDIADWLKSLRPSWRPNKEQMKALADATMRDVFPVGYRECLETLYEQLKKLYL